MWQQSLLREITLITIIKLAALWLLWFVFFRPPDGAVVAHQEVGEVLLGEHPTGPPAQPLANQSPGERNGF